MLKQVLDRMMTDRRIGKNLKGMNKSNLNEIEQAVWTVIDRELSLYHNELEYNRHRTLLKADLSLRKQQLQAQIDSLRSNAHTHRPKPEQ